MSIEWVIYLAELSFSLKLSAFLFTGLNTAGLLLYWMTTWDDCERVFNKRLFMAPIISLFIGAVLPTNMTVYAIAATQLSKEMKFDNTAKKALLVLDKKLDELLLDKDK